MPAIFAVHASHPLFKDYPQVIHGGCMEDIFFELEIKVVVKSDLKDIADCGGVALKSHARGNTDVVHIHVNCGSEGFMLEYNVSKDEVHHGLERRR